MGHGRPAAQSRAASAEAVPALARTEPARSAHCRAGSVRASAGTASAEAARDWAAGRQWPTDTVHALCAVLRSRGRTLGVVTFLRGPGRTPFERTDATYAEGVALRIASALDLEALERSSE